MKNLCLTISTLLFFVIITQPAKALLPPAVSSFDATYTTTLVADEVLGISYNCPTASAYPALYANIDLDTLTVLYSSPNAVAYFHPTFITTSTLHNPHGLIIASNATAAATDSLYLTRCNYTFATCDTILFIINTIPATPSTTYHTYNCTSTIGTSIFIDTIYNTSAYCAVDLQPSIGITYTQGPIAIAPIVLFYTPNNSGLADTLYYEINDLDYMPIVYFECDVEAYAAYLNYTKQRYITFSTLPTCVPTFGSNPTLQALNTTATLNPNDYFITDLADTPTYTVIASSAGLTATISSASMLEVTNATTPDFGNIKTVTLLGCSSIYGTCDTLIVPYFSYYYPAHNYYTIPYDLPFSLYVDTLHAAYFAGYTGSETIATTTIPSNGFSVLNPFISYQQSTYTPYIGYSGTDQITITFLRTISHPLAPVPLMLPYIFTLHYTVEPVLFYNTYINSSFCHNTSRTININDLTEPGYLGPINYTTSPFSPTQYTLTGNQIIINDNAILPFTINVYGCQTVAPFQCDTITLYINQSNTTSEITQTSSISSPDTFNYTQIIAIANDATLTKLPNCGTASATYNPISSQLNIQYITNNLCTRDTLAVSSWDSTLAGSTTCQTNYVFYFDILLGITELTNTPNQNILLTHNTPWILSNTSQVKIWNLEGKQLINTNAQQIPTQSLSKGTYLYQTTPINNPIQATKGRLIIQ